MTCKKCGCTKTQNINGKVVCWKCGEVLKREGQN